MIRQYNACLSGTVSPAGSCPSLWPPCAASSSTSSCIYKVCICVWGEKGGGRVRACVHPKTPRLHRTRMQRCKPSMTEDRLAVHRCACIMRVWDDVILLVRSINVCETWKRISVLTTLLLRQGEMDAARVCAVRDRVRAARAARLARKVVVQVLRAVEGYACGSVVAWVS